MLRSMAFPDDCTTCGAVATTSTQHKLHTQRIVVVTKAQELFQRFFVDPERKQPLNLLRTTIRTLIQPSDRSEVNCFANQPHAVRLFTIQSPDELYGSSLSSPSPQEASQPFGHGNGDILLPNVERRTSNVERRTSNVERRTSNVERRTLNVERRTSNVERRTSNVERSYLCASPNSPSPITTFRYRTIAYTTTLNARNHRTCSTMRRSVGFNIQYFRYVSCL